MKIYIMTDMEGISGIRRVTETDRGQPEYADGQVFMAGDVNAAIDGAFAGGADEVIVCDSHSNGFNLPLSAMDPRAVYVENGGIRDFLHGLDETCDGLFAIGYHAMAGVQNAFLDHTQSTTVFEFSINGVPYGEIGQQCILAGAFGVAQLMVTGDQAAVDEALALTPGIETVAVKKAFARNKVECVHPTVAVEQIRAAAKKAVGLAGTLKPLQLKPPLDVRLTVSGTDEADRIWRQRPWLSRIDGRTVGLVTDNPREILAVF